MRINNPNLDRLPRGEEWTRFAPGVIKGRRLGSTETRRITYGPEDIQ